VGLPLHQAAAAVVVEATDVDKEDHYCQ